MLASAYAILGNAEESVRWLERMADDGMPNYALIEKDPSLASVRPTSHCQAMLARERIRHARLDSRRVGEPTERSIAALGVAPIGERRAGNAWLRMRPQQAKVLPPLANQEVAVVDLFGQRHQRLVLGQASSIDADCSLLQLAPGLGL